MTIFHSLKIAEVAKETEDAISVTFDVPEELQKEYKFTQGQHLTLKADVDGEELRRSYSICTGVDEGCLQVAIKQIEKGKFSTFANTAFEAGQEIDVMVPQGRFFTPLSPSNAKNYLAVAAGSGITPMMSIIKTTLATEPNSTFTLIYGNRTVSSILFLEQIEDLKNAYQERLNVIHILSREPQDTELFNGRITAEKCETLFSGVIDASRLHEAFLCGPEQMIMDVKDFLKNKGMASENIHFELFVTDAAIAAANKPSAEASSSSPHHAVTVIMDGAQTTVTIPEEGKSILDAALEADLDVPFACKGGVCCTCRAKVIQGEVRMDLNYALEDDEVEQGYVLTCQSHPITEDVIVDFDL